MKYPFITHRGYSPSHPWYYYLGGHRLTLKHIRAYAAAKSDEYSFKLMAEETLIADKREEPRRSEDLRKIRERLEIELTCDISRYRELVRELHNNRKYDADTEPFRSCNDIHTSLSLKFAHLYNGFSRLDHVNKLLSKQPDLFDF